MGQLVMSIDRKRFRESPTDSQVQRTLWAASLTFIMCSSACTAGDADLGRELRQKGREQGLGLIRVLNFRSDESSNTRTSHYD